MNMQTIRLMDSSAHEIATAQVTPEGEHYGGIMDLRALPPSMRALFEELEEIVNGQMFVFLDAIQEKIGALSIKAVFDNGADTFDFVLRQIGAPVQPSAQVGQVQATETCDC